MKILRLCPSSIGRYFTSFLDNGRCIRRHSCITAATSSIGLIITRVPSHLCYSAAGHQYTQQQSSQPWQFCSGILYLSRMCLRVLHISTIMNMKNDRLKMYCTKKMVKYPSVGWPFSSMNEFSVSANI